ncbi:MAG: TM2 domain-containing protein [Rhodobacterales bacterium]|jgi:TM2 domain-containing membrane protein YozV|nr:TM2 domain-containing protein [Rhodobacterales bacterium]
MALTTNEQLLIEQRVTNEAPNVAAAYLLWFFLGILSAHRFYLGKPGTAILQILTFFILIGFVWLLVDAFLIPGMIRKKQDDIRSRLESEMLARGSLSMRF